MKEVAKRQRLYRQRLIGFLPPVDKPKTTIATARYLTIFGGIVSIATQPIRVLLVDDHRSVLWGLAKLIESARPELELVDVATCRSEALAAMESTGRTSCCLT